jgi:transcriptional regulator with XRE-family HTH domain
MSVAQRFGENLARYRKRVGFSQEELAIRASLHRTHVGMMERGARVVRIDTLLKLAVALDIRPAELLDGIAWKPGRTTEGRFVETEVPGLGTVQRRVEVEHNG